MKTFKDVCAQGDIYITKTNMAVPDNAIEVKPDNGNLVIAHSETGHHHVMEASKAKLFNLPDDIMNCLLVVENQATLDHLREHDTHEAIKFEKGTYHIRRQREYTPEGFRRVED